MTSFRTQSTRQLSDRDLDRQNFQAIGLVDAQTFLETIKSVAEKNTSLAKLLPNTEALLIRVKGYIYQWSLNNQEVRTDLNTEYIRGALRLEDFGKDASVFLNSISKRLYVLSGELRNLIDTDPKLLLVNAGLLSCLARTKELVKKKDFAIALLNIKHLRPVKEAEVSYDTLRSQIISVIGKIYSQYQPSQEILTVITNSIHRTFTDQERYIGAIGMIWGTLAFNHKVDFARHLTHALCKDFDRNMTVPLVCTLQKKGNTIMDVSLFGRNLNDACIISINQEKSSGLPFERFVMAITHEVVHAFTERMISTHPDEFPDTLWINACKGVFNPKELYLLKPYEQITWALHDFIEQSCLRLQYEGAEGLQSVRNPAHPETERSGISGFLKHLKLPVF